MSTNRAIPQEVVNIYKELNINPVFGIYTYDDDSYACGMGAIYLKNKEPNKHDYYSEGEVLYELGYSQQYITGYVHGFDGKKQSRDDFTYTKEEYDMGFEDGKATREILLSNNDYEIKRWNEMVFEIKVPQIT